MKLIKQSTPYGCFIASVAMLLGESIEQLVQELGHDGSEEIASGVYRAFHYQEIIDLAWRRGLAVIVIELNPDSEDFASKKVWPIKFKVDNKIRFTQYLKSNHGIICGLVNKNYHAVGWDGKEVYDPGQGIITDLDHIDMEIDYFLLFKEIKSK